MTQPAGAPPTGHVSGVPTPAMLSADSPPCRAGGVLSLTESSHHVKELSLEACSCLRADLPRLTWCMGDCCGPCWGPCCPPCCAPCCCGWPWACGGGACWGCCAGAGAGVASAGGGALYPADLHMEDLVGAPSNAQRPSSLDRDVKGSRVMLKAVSTQSNGSVAAHSWLLEQHRRRRRGLKCMHDSR